MRDNQSIFSGLVTTFFLHLFVIGVVIAKPSGFESCGGGGNSDFAEAQVIEASLAFKEVKPKSKQPQKRKKKKFRQKPEDGASRVEEIQPKEKKKETMHVDEDEIDINSVLDKNRKQDEDLSDFGSDEEIPTEGQADGSEWGTEKDARGDPYVGELKGRIYSVWKVPTLETGKGLAIGCVRLDADGKIVARELKERSKNINLARSVEVALKDAPDMDRPVPEELKSLLTGTGICFNFPLN
jgi:hypothetical protein